MLVFISIYFKLFQFESKFFIESLSTEIRKIVFNRGVLSIFEIEVME